MNCFCKRNRLLLRWELIPFVCVSLVLHSAGLWFIGQYSSTESGLIGDYERQSETKPSLAARLLVNGVSVVEANAILESIKPVVFDKNIDATPIKSQNSPLPNSPLPNDFAQNSEVYLPSGRLTRLPSPVNEIDLNIAEIDAAAMPGVIELTVLVKADGTVADVSAFVKDDSAHHFASLITNRFRGARFSPGEIDGKAVNAEFRVTVVSEPNFTPPAGS